MGNRLRARPRGEEGGFFPGLAIVLIVVVVAAGLLQYTASLASSINNKAITIAKSGQGINLATDSIVQLDTTNKLAASILNSAKPLQAKLATIVGQAQSIDAKASSVNSSAAAINNSARSISGSAVSINSTARTVNSTAGGINGTAAKILDVAKRIDFDVRQININLDTTIGIARNIKGDTGNIISAARRANTLAACISEEANIKLLGGAGASAACK